MLADVRERLLDDAVRERLQILRHLARDLAGEVDLDAGVAPEAHQRLAQGRHEPTLLQHGRAQARHQPPQGFCLLGQLLPDLRQHVEAAVDVSGLDHQQRGLERQRRGRDPLDRSVVQVAGDPVPFLFDRGVRPAGDPGPVLVAVLEELEERADRLVGDLRGRHIAGQQEPSRRIGGNPRDPRLEVERLAFVPLDLRMPGVGQPSERRVGSFDGGGQRRPGLAFDRHAIDADHPRERLVGPHDHIALVQLHEPVHGRVEHQPQMLLGAPQRLVRLADAFERHVRLLQSRLAARERLPCVPVRLGAGHLVGEDARRHPAAEEHDHQRRLQRPDAALVVQQGDDGERARTRRRSTRS